MKKYALPPVVAIALGLWLGALGYCGLTFLGCFMDGSPNRYPVAFPVSIFGGILCAAVAAVLVWLYVKLRKKYSCLPLVAADILLALAAVLVGLAVCGKLVQPVF